VYNGCPELQQLRIKRETKIERKREVKGSMFFYLFSPCSDEDRYPAAPFSPVRGVLA